MSFNEPIRELARCKGFDIQIEDHGLPVMTGIFDFGGSAQGFGYSIDMAFVMRLMDVFRVENLQQVNGKPCWVTHTNSDILRVEPLIPNEGKTFDLEEWQQWIKGGYKDGYPSAYTLRTGKK